jgi:type IV pilus assembly protein PilB
LLRQDPDVLMVGEIRDSETARIATQAAQTGHLVLSTLHANDAPAAITRLRFMGIESFNIASGLSLVVAQRLIRRLCDACKQADSHTACYTAVGCALCTQGYKGRVGVFQLMPITPRLQHLIAQDASDIDLNEAAQHEGMRTLLQDGWDKVTQGITSAQELAALSVDV